MTVDINDSVAPEYKDILSSIGYDGELTDAVYKAVLRMNVYQTATLYHAMVGEVSSINFEEVQSGVLRELELGYKPPSVCACNNDDAPAQLKTARAKATNGRWNKVLDGEPVTFSFDESVSLYVRHVFRRAARDWSDAVPPLQLKESALVGDINVTVKYIDGKNGTLGFTYVPSESADFDAANSLAGDIFIDEDVARWPTPTLYTTIAHELGHAIGLSHSSDGSSLMYPMILRGMKRIPKGDALAANAKYPEDLTLKCRGQT